MPVNFAASQVVTAPSPATSGTTLTVVPGDGASLPGVPFNAVVTDSSNVLRSVDAASEIVRVTNVSTDTLTIIRAQEGTAARTIVVGDRFYAGVFEGVTAGYFPNLGTSSIVPGVMVPPTGSVVGGTTDGWYAHQILLLSATTITGIRYNVGTAAAAGTVRAALYDSTGATRVAEAAPVAQGTATLYQSIAFSAQYSADPGVYYALLWLSSAAASFLRAGFMLPTATGTLAGATPTSISPSVVQVPIPVLSTY